MLKICAANWKLNFTPEEARRYFTEWSNLKAAPQLSCEVAFFTPAYDLPVASEFAPPDGFYFGPQNIFYETSGAYTGEISPQAVRALGAHLALIGHSERRTIFGENDAVIAKKVKVALASELVPMLCVGESLAEREANKTRAVVKTQLEAGLSLVTGQLKTLLSQRKSAHQALAPLVIAYEPVWAIGTGKVATPEQAREMHGEIRTLLGELLGANAATEVPILYGGSVKPDNAKELASQPNIDGFLVGGASLKPKDFLAVARSLA